MNTPPPGDNVAIRCHTCGASLVTSDEGPTARILGMLMRGWHFECGLDNEGWWALFYAPEDAGTSRYEKEGTAPTFDDAVRAAEHKALRP